MSCVASSSETPLEIQLREARIYVDEKRHNGTSDWLVLRLRRGGLEEYHKSTAGLGWVSIPVPI